MAKIYFITGVMDEKHNPGEPSHKGIYEHSSQYAKDIKRTVKFIKTRLEKNDFLSITITRDNHEEE